MKKYVAILLLALLCATGVQADFLGVKKASETIAFPVHPPLDSAGIPGAADSIQITTYADDDATAAYKATGAAYTCTGIDTTLDYGGTHIWFADQIQDIDGNGGNVELAIQVIAWYKKLPTYTFMTVQVIGDSLENLLDASMDSSSSAAVLAKNGLDTLQAQDGWIAKEASVQIVRDTQALYDNWIRDSIHNQSVAVLAGTMTAVATVNALAAGQYTKIGDSAAAKTWGTTSKIVTRADSVGAGGVDAFWNDDNTARVLRFAGVHLTAVGVSDTALGIIGGGGTGGYGANISSAGKGLAIAGANNGLFVFSSTDHAVEIDGSTGTGTHGIYTVGAGDGTGKGLKIVGGTDGLDSVTVDMSNFNTQVDSVPVHGMDSVLAALGNTLKKTDSALVDMSSLNTTLDDDTSLVAFLRAAISAGGYDPATDSVLVDMSSFNAALDNDTSLVAFLRALIGMGAGSGADSEAVFGALVQFMQDSTMNRDTLNKIIFDQFVQFMQDSTMNQNELFALIDSAAGDTVTVTFDANDTVNADVVHMQNNVITADAVHGNAAAEIGDTSLNKDTLAAPYIYEIYTEDTTGFDTMSVPVWQTHNLFGAITDGLANITETYYAYDTSNSVVVENVIITFMHLNGSSVGTGITNASGYCTAKLQQSDSYTVSARNPVGYTWETLDTIVMGATSTQKDTVYGAYTLSLFTPTDSFLCRVYGYLRSIGGVDIEGARVVASLGQLNVQDTCNGVILSNYQISTTTDSVGYWYLDILRSKCIKATDQKYKLSITYPGSSQTVSKVVTVPDSASYKVVW